jgi:hypothetical protein
MEYSPIGPAFKKICATRGLYQVRGVDGAGAITTRSLTSGEAERLALPLTRHLYAWVMGQVRSEWALMEQVRSASIPGVNTGIYSRQPKGAFSILAHLFRARAARFPGRQEAIFYILLENLYPHTHRAESSESFNCSHTPAG